jgi:hypothetical protein
VFCRVVFGVLVLAYLFALAVFAVGTFGWFGADEDPLAGAYLIILGMPWVLLPFDVVVGEAALPLVAILAPLVNLAIVWAVCRRLAR